MYICFVIFARINTTKKNMEIWFQESLINWYAKNQRDLPWRKTYDPYCIWVSEVILQQTRVAQGIDYYKRFIKQFPNVFALAQATEDEVFLAWQGLGFYTRARNLHYAAKRIAEKGKFPAEYNEIKSLKGIGDYTSAAICSIAYNQPYAVVDGNVYRVLSRIFAIDTAIDTTIGKKTFQDLANYLLDTTHPRIYNQALMEFGALQCVPKNPNCLQCIFNSKCLAFASNKIYSYPNKTKQIKVRDRYFIYVFVFDENNNTYIWKREENDIWKGLYQPLLLEVTSKQEYTEIIKSPILSSFLQKGNTTLHRYCANAIHKLTHQRIHADFYTLSIEPASDYKLPDKCIKVTAETIKQYAMPELIKKHLPFLE